MSSSNRILGLWDLLSEKISSMTSKESYSATAVAATAATAGVSYYALKKALQDYDQPCHGYEVRPAWLNVLKTATGRVSTTEHYGGELVANVLKAHGVNFVFTLVGGHISPILAASEASDIRVIDVRHEVNAVFAADAVARLTGVPGVATVTAGPGVTNTVTAVKNAQMAESPIVLLGGAAATLSKGRGALQDIDQMSILKPLCKFTATVTRTRDIVPTLRKAFKMAASGTPGPVFVEFPIDVLYPINEVRANLKLLQRDVVRNVVGKSELYDSIVLPEEALKKGLSVEAYLKAKPANAPVFLEKQQNSNPWIVDKYLRYYIQDLFSSRDENKEYGPLPVHVPLPSTGQVNQVASILKKAEKPVMIVQSQALLQHPTPAKELVKAIERLGIPCFLGGMGRGLLGTDHNLQIRQNRRGALKEADVVILAGTLVDFRLDYGRLFSKKSKIVAINRSDFNLKQNTDAFWSPTVAAKSDPASFLVKLGEHHETTLKGKAKEWQSWVTHLKQSESKKEQENRRKAEEPAIGHDAMENVELVNPLKLCFELDSLLSENSILVGDGGDFVATASYTARPRGPLQWLDPGAFGTLGVGAGFALGAKLVHPEADVWILWGDGSVGYSVAEFDTFLRHNVPVGAVVGNDACWTQIERDQVPILNTRVACPLRYTAYEMIARGYGGEGTIVRETNQTSIRNALLQARESIRNGQSFLVNVLIGKTNFREGSISV